MTTDFRALCAELLDKYDLEWRARERIKAALAAEPEPEKPNLKEQALSVLDDVSDQLDAAHENALRRALEAMP